MAKPQNNYFTRNIQNDGEDFLSYKNDKNIRFELPTILRQLCSRKIDLENYGHFFLDLKFLDNIINCIGEIVNESGIVHNAINTQYNIMMMNRMIIPNEFQNVAQKYKCRFEVYSYLLGQFKQLKMTGNLNVLYIIVSQVSNNAAWKNAI